MLTRNSGQSAAECIREPQTAARNSERERRISISVDLGLHISRDRDRPDRNAQVGSGKAKVVVARDTWNESALRNRVRTADNVLTGGAIQGTTECVGETQAAARDLELEAVRRGTRGEVAAQLLPEDPERDVLAADPRGAGLHQQ